MPESNKDFFKSPFDTIAVEVEGICICGGDLNVLTDNGYNLWLQLVLKRNMKSITKRVRNTCEDMDFFMCGEIYIH